MEIRAKDLQTQLDQLNQTKEQLEGRMREKQESTTQESSQEMEVEFPDQEEVEELAQQEKEFEELAKELVSPEFASELAKGAQQAVQQVQNPTQAQELAKEMAKLVKQLQQQVQHVQFVSADGVEGAADKLVDQELDQLKQDLKNTQTSLAELCRKHNLSEPDTKPDPPISKETLKGAFNQTLDMLLPASDLIKIAMGTMEVPTTNKEWVKLAVNTVLDFMPGGKMLRLLKSGMAKKLEGHILKLVAKKVKKAISIPKGFKQTKQFGYQHGQKVYEYKGKYYSRDIGSGNGRGSHNGGVWKVFEQRNGKLQRIGTADEKLKIFKK